VLPFLQMRKDALNMAAHQPLPMVVHPIFGRELNVVRARSHARLALVS
jgi:hypothetical protein